MGQLPAIAVDASDTVSICSDPYDSRVVLIYAVNEVIMGSFYLPESFLVSFKNIESGRSSDEKVAFLRLEACAYHVSRKRVLPYHSFLFRIEFIKSFSEGADP